MLMEFFWSQCQVLSVCRSSQYLNFIPPQWDLWALNCRYVGLYGSVNASLIFIQANETFWHNSARLELYTKEGGGSQDLKIYHMLSIRMKELILFYFGMKKGREGNPTFLSAMLLWLQGQSLSHVNEHCMAQPQHILTATLQGLFLICPLFLSLLYPSLHPQRWMFPECGCSLLFFHGAVSSVVPCGSCQCVFTGHLALLFSRSPLRAEELCGVHWDSWHRGWDLQALRSDIQHTETEVRATSGSVRGIQGHCSAPFWC